MKYIVMECRPSYAIVLDEEGRFLRTANLRYEVGQTVEHVVLMREQKALSVRLRVLAGAAGAAGAGAGELGTPGITGLDAGTPGITGFGAVGLVFKFSAIQNPVSL